MKKITALFKTLALLLLLLNVKTGSAQCNGTFNYTIGSGGLVTFVSTATTTGSFTQYSWNFGFTTSVVPAPTTSTSVIFPANGTYTVTLTASGTCTGTSTQTVGIFGAGCPLTASFAATPGLMGNYNFNPTVSGTVSGTTYTYNFGDNTTTVGLPSSHQYTANGSYTVTLSATNSSTCTSTYNGIVTVTNACTPSASLSPSFIYSINGSVVTLTSTTTNTIASTVYEWYSFGPLPASTTINIPGGFSPTTSVTYPGTGTYLIGLNMYNSATPNCSYSAVTNTVNINSIPCSLLANFSYTAAGGGIANFSNASTGTITGTTYNLYYGDGSTGSNFSPHTYTANGSYIATLTAVNSASCTSSYTLVVSITNVCAASFTYTISSPGTVNFRSTSTPTTVSDQYMWYFSNGLTSTLNAMASTNYTANGTYYVTMQYTTGPCASSATNIVNITGYSAPCSLNPAFSHIVGSGGTANFTGASALTGTNVMYTWYFGDGYSTSGNPANHTYMNNGAYAVKLIALDVLNPSCKDSTALSVNITGASCNANAWFSLNPSDTLQVWTATPVYPWNISGAEWSWGDGSTSNLLYTSHTYSAAGNYSICLTVTASCGNTATACSTFDLNKPASGSSETGIVKINVIAPGIVPLSIKNEALNNTSFDIYPNPNNGLFTLRSGGTNEGKGSIAIYDMVGRLAYKTEPGMFSAGTEEALNLEALPDGIYFIQLTINNRSCTKKLVVNK